MGTHYTVASNLDFPQAWDVPSIGHSYTSPTGDEFPLHHCCGWCDCCSSLVCCESLRKESEVCRELLKPRMGTISDARYAELQSEPRKWNKLLRPVSRIAQNIYHRCLMLELDLLRSRHSEARCLQCGSTCITYPDEDGLIQLRNERWLRLTIAGFANIWGVFGVYDYEGIRVRDSTWHGSA